MLASQIKTPSDLKMFVESYGTSHFFDRKTMQFFGDTMRNFGLCRVSIQVSYDDKGEYVGKVGGLTIDAFELYRKRAVKHGNTGSFYFNATTFKQVFPAK